MGLQQLENEFLIAMEEFKTDNEVVIDKVNDNITEDGGVSVGEITYLMGFKDTNLTVDIFFYNKEDYEDKRNAEGYDVVVNKTKTDKNFEYREYKYAGNTTYHLLDTINKLKRK